MNNSKSAFATLLVAKLDRAEGWAVRASHDALLDFLRKEHLAFPDWESYPRARSIFTQMWR
jgi:hypothetical protein